jgi:hypothetical protein
MGQISGALLAIVSGAIALAIVAVVVSQRAQTPNVLSAAGGALANVIGAAVSPVSGTSSNQFGSASSSALGGLHAGFSFP